MGLGDTAAVCAHCTPVERLRHGRKAGPSMLLALLLLLGLIAPEARAQENLLDAAPASAALKDKSKPMLLQADELVYDNAGSKITAKGIVMNNTDKPLDVEVAVTFDKLVKPVAEATI